MTSTLAMNPSDIEFGLDSFVTISVDMPVILAAIAARTKRIRVGTSVTVLSTQDPVRTYINSLRLMRCRTDEHN